MTKQFLKDSIMWGSVVWLIGYLLGMLLFAFVPHAFIGWIIMPIGILVALWVLTKKVKSQSFQYYLLLSLVWTLIAILFDYVFLVSVFKPQDGYYKVDVYLYYALTFLLPLYVGWRKRNTAHK